MKKIAFLILITISTCKISLSQVAINNDGSVADNSAILDVKSNTRGFLLPRMTLQERSAIHDPANGLLLYCTDCGTGGTGALYMHMAGAWFTFTTTCIFPIPPVAGTHVALPDQITWNWNPVTNATGYKWSDVNDYGNATDLGAVTSFTDTNLDCNTAFTRYVWVYSACGTSEPLVLNQSTSACVWACGDSLTVIHVAGAVAPVNKTTTYGTVNSVPGEPSKCWITSNLGADHQATVINDNTEPSAGWYWQFNRQQGYKHDGMTRTPNTAWITSIVENSGWQDANDPCRLLLDTTWRLPTSTEWFNVDNAGGWLNQNGAWNSLLKLHLAGYLANIFGLYGYLISSGNQGYYWGSNQNSNSFGSSLNFNIASCIQGGANKAQGSTVRCLKN